MKLLTTGEIAKQLNTDRDKVSYALRKLKIEPDGIAGAARVFSETAQTAVKTFLQGQAQRGQGNA
jgi:hypothetical protein